MVLLVMRIVLKIVVVIDKSELREPIVKGKAL